MKGVQDVFCESIGSDTAATAAAPLVDNLRQASAELEFHQWVSKLGAKHKLYHCHGMVFCGKCGCFGSASNKARNLLQAECRRTLPAGSKSKVQRAMRGRCPYKMQSWPDGTPASQRGEVRRILSNSLSEPVDHKQELEDLQDCRSTFSDGNPAGNWQKVMATSPMECHVVPYSAGTRQVTGR